MTDRYELENSSGFLILENGSDYYEQDYRIVTSNDILGLNENGNTTLNLVKTVSDTLGFTEVTNKIRGFFKNITDTLGLVFSSVVAPPSLFEYLLEDGSGTLFLEDGTGNYEQDIPLVLTNETLGLSENSNRLGTLIRNVNETLGLSEVAEEVHLLTKVVNETLGFTENTLTETTTLNYLLEGVNPEHYKLEDGTGGYQVEIPVYVVNETMGLVENVNIQKTLIRQISDTLLFTDVVNTAKGFFKVVTEAILNFEEIVVKKLTEVNVYFQEDGSGHYLTEEGDGFYELNQNQLTHINNDVLGLVENIVKVPGQVKVILDQLNLVETFNRFQNVVKVIAEDLGLVEASNRLMNILKNIATETIDLTENSNRLGTIIRNISEELGLTELTQRLRGIVRNTVDTLELTESMLYLEGIVKVVGDTLGFTDLFNKIRTVSISNHLGFFTATRAINLENFSALRAIDIGNMTVIDSYNFGDFIIIDDN